VVRKAKPSSTAQNVALVRAHLTWLGIIDDRFAAPMLRPLWASTDRLLRLPVVSRLGRSRTFAWLAARTRFFDDAVTDALDAGVRQVVVMAAGYDSRAWRLARPGVTFYEVDHPATQHDKRRRAPEGGPSYVPVEFGAGSVADALIAAGYRTDEPAVFTVEGVTMYLTEPQVRDLLTTLRGLGAAGSRLAVNFGLGVDGAGQMGARAARLHFRVSGEHITYRPSIPQAAAVLADTGWTAGPALTAPELVRRYVTGTCLPTADIKPTAFALTAV
jgi:methyltransferase (TIGR00027 family)